MDSSLPQAWESAKGNPFLPFVSKGSQFFIGFTLLGLGLLLTGLFGLNRSLLNIGIIGGPASLAFAFGAVYMICAVGVYRRQKVILAPPSQVYSSIIRARMSIVENEELGLPVFKAVSNSARQLFQLLNCIRFAPKAQVQLSNEGLRFAVEDSRAMQGIVFLEKALFTSFNCIIPPLTIDPDPDADESTLLELPTFQINLLAFLETLQIFGAADIVNSRFSKPDNDGYTSNIRPHRQNAFSNQALGIHGLCRLSYMGVGSPFSIILDETDVKTTCNLNTYEPDNPDEIPFERDRIQVKIIMQARWLYDAVQELSPVAASRIDITASPNAPYLSLAATGNLGSASIDFGKGRELLDTFTVAERWTQSYKFEMIKAASEAMRLASKVSMRGDEQGVLSLQFMVEGEGGSISFIDFRFVPYVRDEDESNEEEYGDAAEERIEGQDVTILDI